MRLIQLIRNVIFIQLLVSSFLCAQSDSLPNYTRNNENTFLSLYAGLGFLEFNVVGIEFPVTNKIKAGLKLSRPFFSGSRGIPVVGWGPGIKLLFFTKDITWVSAINIEATYANKINSQDHLPFGWSGELNIEKKNIDKWFHWYCKYGVGASVAPGIRPYIYPCVKFGLIFNLSEEDI